MVPGITAALAWLALALAPRMTVGSGSRTLPIGALLKAPGPAVPRTCQLTPKLCPAQYTHNGQYARRTALPGNLMRGVLGFP